MLLEKAISLIIDHQSIVIKLEYTSTTRGVIMPSCVLMRSTTTSVNVHMVKVFIRIIRLNIRS